MGEFKDLRVWQDALKLSVEIYAISRQAPFADDYGLCNQIRKAAVSIASNIAEGDERGTNPESIRFFNIAKGSSAEVITQLHIAHKIGYLDSVNFENLKNYTEKIRFSLKKLIKARRNNPYKP